MDISLNQHLQPGKSLTNHGNGRKMENATDSAGDEKKRAELKEACQGFEAIFIQNMMKAMRSTLPGDALFEKSQGMEIYTSMYDQYLAENISRGENSTGVGEYLYRQLQDAL